MGQFRILSWVSEDLDVDVLKAYFRVLKLADVELRANPAPYLPFWERSLWRPPRPLMVRRWAPENNEEQPPPPTPLRQPPPQPPLQPPPPSGPCRASSSETRSRPQPSPVRESPRYCRRTQNSRQNSRRDGDKRRIFLLPPGKVR